MSKLTLFVVSGKIDRVGRLHGRSKLPSELVWRSWVRGVVVIVFTHSTTLLGTKSHRGRTPPVS